MALLQTGPVRLAVLNSDGSKAKTLILPAPDKGFPTLEFEEKTLTRELVDGSERTRVLGYLPVLTLEWGVYPDGQATGTGDGQTPTLEALLEILSGASGTLRVSAGTTAQGFTADRAAVKEIGRRGAFYTGVAVTFRGRSSRASRTLETF